MVGLSTSAGAFLAFGITPLAAAPSANADEFDVAVEPILNSLLNRPGMSGDSTSWERWGHVRWFVEEVSAGAA